MLIKTRNMLKVGIVRCAIVAEFCPATSCIKAVKEGKGAFEGIEAELVGFMTCGGCPGKKVTASVKTLLEKGANAIISVRFTTSVLMGGAAEMMAYGTAVITEKE